MLRSSSVREEHLAIHRQKSHWQVLRRAWNGILADDCLDLAAQMSFYFALSIFPFLLVVASIMGWLPFTNIWQTFAQWIITYLPRDSRHLLFSTIVDLTHGYKGFFSVGVLGMIWSASAGFVSLMEALSAAHGVRETRGYVKKHTVAIIATLGAALFFIASFGVMTVGQWARTAFSSSFSPDAHHVAWAVVRWLVTLLLMCIGVDLIDHFLPDIKRPWRWFPASSIFVSVTFVLATEGVNFYVRHTSSFSKVYGAIAGFIIFLLWVYIANLILLIGAEADKATRVSGTRGASA